MIGNYKHGWEDNIKMDLWVVVEGNCLCSVIVLRGMMMIGREKVKPGAGS